MKTRKRMLALLIFAAMLIGLSVSSSALETQDNNSEAELQLKSSMNYTLLGWSFFLSDTSSIRRNITNGYKKPDSMHAAIDVAGTGISSVYARPVYEGTILKAWDDKGGFGNYVVLETNQLDPANTPYGPQRKIRVGYAHLQDLSFVYEGKPVGIGNNIGKVGNTGNSNGYHMHLLVFRVPTNAGSSAQSELSWTLDTTRSNCINPERFYYSGYFTGVTNSVTY